MMGSKKYEDEQPIYSVSVPTFWMGQYQVTQELWISIMGENPSYFKGLRNPVETISWDDVQLFLEKLNEHEEVKQQNAEDGLMFRLPSEAQWEYAARGGVYESPFTYAGSSRLKEVGWYRSNWLESTMPVGLCYPNQLGLYDMSGNVWEWCADHWHRTYKEAPDDGSAWIKGGNEKL